jgi:hypothetical protein
LGFLLWNIVQAALADLPNKKTGGNSGFLLRGIALLPVISRHLPDHGDDTRPIAVLNHFFLLRQDRLKKISPDGELLSFVSTKESNQRKLEPGYARKPDENQQFEALGQLARRYHRRTQTLPSLRPQTIDLHRLASTGIRVF